MGCNASAILKQVAPNLPTNLPTSPEILVLLGKFYTTYPELQTIIISSNKLSVDQKKQFDSDNATFLSQVPVPTMDQLYTFVLKQIKTYNINIQPTTAEINTLITNYATKYYYMQDYLSAVNKLTSDQQVVANKSIQDFLNSYPLGSVDDFYNLQINILSQYNLPLPPGVTDISGVIVSGFTNPRPSVNNVTNLTDINYSKISPNMNNYISKNNLTEKSYSPFSRNQ